MAVLLQYRADRVEPWRAALRAAMPEEEIRLVVTTRDPELVRIVLELHLERLDERLLELRRTVAGIGRSLVESIGTVGCRRHSLKP